MRSGLPPQDDTAVHEPSRAVEWLAAGLLLGFFAVAAMVRFRWGPTLLLDQTIVDDAYRAFIERPWLASAAEAASHLGDTVFRWTVIAIVAAWLAFGHRRFEQAAFIIGVELLGGAMNLLLKAAFARERPSLDHPITLASGASFPSGHAMNSMTFYALLASVVAFSGLVAPWLQRVLLPLLIVLPLLVGVSRVLLDVHYATDVIGGWLFGAGWVALATAVVQPWRPHGARRRWRRHRGTLSRPGSPGDRRHAARPTPPPPEVGGRA